MHIAPYIGNSYTMGCPPVRGHYPQVLASTGRQTWYNYFIPLYISVDIVNHEIFCAEVGKGGINLCNLRVIN